MKTNYMCCSMSELLAQYNKGNTEAKMRVTPGRNNTPYIKYGAAVVIKPINKNMVLISRECYEKIKGCLVIETKSDSENTQNIK